MLRLRPYKTSDADIIVSWCKDEETFRKWTSDRYDSYPITAVDMNEKYISNNGDCIEPDNFYPMTAFDENGIVGHLIMRFTDEKKSVLRFGFVIVDDSRRGMGYGREMISLSLKYAFEILKVDKVTIGVFENNMSAYWCYKAVGFKDAEAEDHSCDVFGEVWKVIELQLTKDEYALNNQN
ncbi:MAG: GNAT family N-acetyltransferase [Oscillospiraceae bacterium]|nr:GNAT family N-acetyltransferase [Oscillospiraceae bacterium]